MLSTGSDRVNGLKKLQTSQCCPRLALEREDDFGAICIV